MVTDAIFEECRSHWSQQVSAMVTTQLSQLDLTFPLCEMCGLLEQDMIHCFCLVSFIPRPSLSITYGNHSVYTNCKWSQTRRWEGLRMRLLFTLDPTTRYGHSIPRLLMPPTLIPTVSIHASLYHTFFIISIHYLAHWQPVIGDKQNSRLLASTK